MFGRFIITQVIPSSIIKLRLKNVYLDTSHLSLMCTVAQKQVELDYVHNTGWGNKGE